MAKIYGTMKFYGVRCDEQPLCRYCAREIPKSTTMIYCMAPDKEETYSATTSINRVFVLPKNMEEVRKLTNYRIVSVSRSYDKAHIDSFNVWDGETYKDDLFCTVNCAANFGRLMAGPKGGNNSTVKYAEAIKARREKV